MTNRRFPILESEAILMTASRFNRVRLALHRLTPAWGKLRIPLIGLHDLELVIDRDCWVCIDTGLGNLPIMAWRGFERAHPSGFTGLHHPVRVQLDYYNLHANLIRGRVLEIMDNSLAAKLRQGPRPIRAQVLPFQPRRRQPFHSSFYKGTI